MKFPARYCSLFIILPATAFAHGTEAGGLVFGSLGSAGVAAILLVFVPGPPARKRVVLRSVAVAIVATWC